MRRTTTYRVNALSGATAPQEGILSRTLDTGDGARVVWFGLAAGEEMSEHTAARAAVIHVLSGAITMTLAGEQVDGRPGTLVHMPPGLPHALRAREPSTMLLTLLPAPAA